MMNRIYRFTVCIAVFWGLVGSPSAFAWQKQTETQKNTSEENAGKKPQPIQATNVLLLRKRVGQTVAVVGKVAQTNVSSKSGHHFLNFYGKQFSVVCFREDAAKFKDAPPAKKFRDREVEVTGKLESYKGRLQIKLTDPKQIKIVATGKVASNGRPSKVQPRNGKGPPGGTGSPTNTKRPATRPFELKKVGEDTWISPAGLRYAGRDPAGQTRLAHVLRHAQDIPGRAGSHGVFDGGRDGALAVIDEAWRRAQEKRLRPSLERDRAAYSIPMGRRVGFLGGRTGKQKRHPTLYKVFIVVEKGTKNVVTAFPR